MWQGSGPTTLTHTAGLQNSCCMWHLLITCYLSTHIFIIMVKCIIQLYMCGCIISYTIVCLHACKYEYACIYQYVYVIYIICVCAYVRVCVCVCVHPCVCTCILYVCLPMLYIINARPLRKCSLQPFIQQEVCSITLCTRAPKSQIQIILLTKHVVFYICHL